MHRLLADTTSLESERPELGAAARKHLRVLRPKDGEAVELFDGKGRSRVYHFDAARGELSHPQEVLVHLVRPSLVLFACITKGSRWDWTIEKATELGVSRIVPVISARTIVRIAPDERVAKRERWLRIAEDAARQSDAKWLPEIDEAVDFASALDRVRETNCLVGALTNPPPPTILRELDLHRESIFTGRPPAVFVGPEGDFTPDELAALLRVATPVSFGASILRAETAAIYGVAILKAMQDARVS